MTDGVTESELKLIFKQALTEVLEERRDLFYDLFSEVVEDIGLANAIREANIGEQVDESVIFQMLDPGE
jgi:hypothetical protein